jgi:hypothetical protein
LLRHTLDQLVDIFRLLPAGLDVLVVLLLQLLHEGKDQFLFLGDDLLASLLLDLDVLVELLAVLLLLEFLPRPVDFDILLVRGDDFILNFLGTLSLQLLLADAALVLELIRMCANLGDDL